MKVRTDAKREAILETASAAFLELGYERASMAEISTRIGGSKATLYGYFPSKDALFVAVTTRYGARHMEPALSELSASEHEPPAVALQRFGERILGFMCSPEAVSAHRMVLAEAAHSDVGRLFYEAGPRLGMVAMAQYMGAAMAKGALRQADAEVAAQHFHALVVAEVQPRWFLRDAPKVTRPQIKAMVERAVAAFVGGYAAQAGGG